MSTLPCFCYICEYFNMNEHICKIYPNGVPKDILLGKADCDKCCIKETEDKDLPIVKRIPGTPFYEVIEDSNR